MLTVERKDQRFSILSLRDYAPLLVLFKAKNVSRSYVHIAYSPGDLQNQCKAA